jgi:hypothetical protein
VVATTGLITQKQTRPGGSEDFVTLKLCAFFRPFGAGDPFFAVTGGFTTG